MTQTIKNNVLLTGKAKTLCYANPVPSLLVILTKRMISDTIAKKERGDCMKKIEVICSFCGAIKSYSPKSGVPKENKHNITCSGYFQSLIEKELGTKERAKLFSICKNK